MVNLSSIARFWKGGRKQDYLERNTSNCKLRVSYIDTIIPLILQILYTPSSLLSIFFTIPLSCSYFSIKKKKSKIAQLTPLLIYTILLLGLRNLILDP
jgi:hypothetical protein